MVLLQGRNTGFLGPPPGQRQTLMVLVQEPVGGLVSTALRLVQQAVGTSPPRSQQPAGLVENGSHIGLVTRLWDLFRLVQQAVGNEVDQSQSHLDRSLTGRTSPPPNRLLEESH